MAHPQVLPDPNVVDRPARVGIIGGTGALGGGLRVPAGTGGPDGRSGHRARFGGRPPRRPPAICAVAPVGFDERGPFDEGPALASRPGASLAEWVADAAPQTQVVAAFHTVSSEELAAVTRPMDDALPIAGDHDDACSVVEQLANAIDGCRGVVVGRLRLASRLEALPPVLIAVNQRASARVGVRFSRPPPATGSTDGG